MGMCDMCGAEEQLFLTDIEGTKLNVCKNCAKFGKVIAEVRAQEEAPKKDMREEKAGRPARRASELVQVVSEDFSERIKNAREKLGLKQEELAKKMAERASLIQKMEQGQFTPSISLARKLENHLRIKLIEQHEEKHDGKFRSGGASLTIGDMLELKK